MTVSPICFGVRKVPPCPDCWDDGQCSMNCGPARRDPIEYNYDPYGNLMSGINRKLPKEPPA